MSGNNILVQRSLARFVVVCCLWFMRILWPVRTGSTGACMRVAGVISSWLIHPCGQLRVVDNWLVLEDEE